MIVCSRRWSAAALAGLMAVFVVSRGLVAAPPKPQDSPTGAGRMLTVRSDEYGTTKDGQAITHFTLTNRNGMEVGLINFGGILTKVSTPDRDGTFKNINLGFKTLAEYEANKPYFGGLCGRFANRIANGRFTLDGKTYQLAQNNGNHHLHGGVTSFIKRVWTAEPIREQEAVGVRLTYVSPDGEENYPGTLTSVVEYRLNDANELSITYAATTDKPTILNLTNHAYWNLSGEVGGTILDHELTLAADTYLEIDEGSIPSGRKIPVAGTCMDFKTPHTIGERITETTNGYGGYDHCYVVNGEIGKLRPAARVVHPATGRVMEVLTTEPGIQLYTGNYLEGTPETGNAPKQGAFCLEAQHLPDSPNRPEFPTTRLNPGETYRQTTVHRFSVAK